MASIDDIWAEPVTPVSPRTPRQLDTDDDEPQRPAKRQKQALFLSDSEEEGGDGGGIRRDVVKAPPPVPNPDIDDDVEALFADAENDDGLQFKGFGDLDMAAMEREAEERHRRPPPPTPHPIMPSSSPTQENSNPGKTGGLQNNKGKNKGKDGKTRARPVPLNENLLLGPTGFPDLVSQTKDLKVRGKGYEMEDLTRLMRVYNFWTHKLHPKLKFRDTVVRIEKLCHTKRMQVALSVWRDEAHGKSREPDADLSLDSDVDDEGHDDKSSRKRTSQPLTSISEGLSSLGSSGQNNDRNDLSLSSSRASTQPPTSDFPDDDDLFGPSASSHTRANDAAATSASTIAKKQIIVDSDDDEEESFWKELETIGTLQPNQQQSRSQPDSGQSLDNIDDAEMWAALEEGIKPSSASGQQAPEDSRAATDKAGDMDIDDDDIWEIIGKNQNTAPASQLPTSEPKISGAEPTTETRKSPSPGQQTVADSEMDWHDMYA